VPFVLARSRRERMGHLNVAREMFHMIVKNFPQARYQYYVAHARLGLVHLDVASHAALNDLTMQ
jgi:hypothetical protein